MRFTRSAFIVAAFGAALVVSAACREATMLRVFVETDMPCSRLQGIVLSVGPSASDAESEIPSVVYDACHSGGYGDITLVPANAKDGPVSLKVAVGVDVRAEQCTPGRKYEGCVVARRRLAYLPHTELRVKVRLIDPCRVVCDAHGDCPNACTAETTCARPGGKCVSSEIDPSRCTADDSSDGCVLEGEAPLAGEKPPLEDAGDGIDGGQRFDGSSGGNPGDGGNGRDSGDSGGAGDGGMGGATDCPGAQVGSPWPAQGRCSAFAGRGAHLGPQTKSVLFSTPLPSGLREPVIDANGALWFGGNEVRQVSATGMVAISALRTNTSAVGILLPDTGNIYAYDGPTSTLLAVRKTDGMLMWSYFLAPSTKQSVPIVGPMGRIFLQASDRVIELSPSGAFGASHNVTAPASGIVTPALSLDGMRLYVADDTGHVLALDTNSLGQVWSATTVMGPVGGHALAVAPNSDVIACDDGYIQGLNAGTGMPEWSFFIGDASGFTTAPAVGIDNTVYIGATNGNVYAVKGGVQRWVYFIDAITHGTPVVGPDDTVYVASNVGLHAIAPNGRILWEDLNAAGFDAVVMGADGTLYAHRRDDFLVVYQP